MCIRDRVTSAFHASEAAWRTAEANAQQEKGARERAERELAQANAALAMAQEAMVQADARAE
eukprot:6306350-Prymnesium_polylepis.1